MIRKTNQSVDVISQIMTVTPAMAKKWLEQNTNNRRLVQQRVDKIAAMIERGLWRISHQGVAFYEDDTLADGQHRLSAIVKANKSVQVLVVYGLKKEANEVIDGGGLKPRTLADNLVFEGKGVAQFQISTYRSLLKEYRRQQVDGLTWNADVPNTHDFATFCDVMKLAVDFAVPVRPRRDVACSHVYAAVAAAWFTKDRDRLSEYLEVYNSGICRNDEDQPALAMNRHVMARRARTSTAEGLEMFRKACCSIRNFIDRHPIAHLQPGKESFSIPRVLGL